MSIDPYEWDVCSLAKHAEALAAERDAAIAELEQWRGLSDVGTLHANLLRGRPARLPRHLLLHLLGDGEQRADDDRRLLRDEVDRLRELIRAHVRDDPGDTWGALLRAVGYDCE